MFGLDIMTYEDQAGCGPFLGLVKTDWRMYIDWNGLFYVAMTRVFHFFWPYSYKKQFHFWLSLRAAIMP